MPSAATAWNPPEQLPTNRRGNANDHRLPRPLHHRAQGAGKLAQPADRRHQGPGRHAQGRRPEDQRRRTARIHRNQPAAPDEGARQRHHAVLAACELHGAPHRRLQRVLHLGRDLQRAVLSRQPAVPGPLRAGGDAAAVARRRPEDLHSRAGEVRQGIRQRRHQPQPRPFRWPLDLAAAHATSTGTPSTRRWWSTTSRR